VGVVEFEFESQFDVLSEPPIFREIVVHVGREKIDKWLKEQGFDVRSQSSLQCGESIKTM